LLNKAVFQKKQPHLIFITTSTN